jgi:Asp-tRNA(Asn)/Glu-tRNA(Gln) amidotransferase A subunit family amidase
MRLGIMKPWFEHAAPPVLRSCRAGVEALRAAGAEVVDVDIPDLKLVRPVHLVTIVAEMAAALAEHQEAHHADYGLDARFNIALGHQLSAIDYVHAQRHRTRICEHFAAAFARVHAILTPTTARTAPLLAEDALATGESNLEELEQLMRFAPVPNLTGLPAVSVPVGYDDRGLPVGLQIMGRAWEEHVILRLAAVVERTVPRREPRVRFRLLD